MSLVAPAPFLPYECTITKRHKNTFCNDFSDRDLTLVANTDENASSSRDRLLDLKRRFKQVLRITSKRRNVVEPATSIPTTKPPHHHHHPPALPSLFSPVCGSSNGMEPVKGILKKQPSPMDDEDAPQSPSYHSQRRKVQYNEMVTIHDTFGPCEYDRSIDTLAVFMCLTPEIAHAIKEDLNFFKFNEMQVHPASRVYTHFFI